jgi:flagellar motor switch protein FliM
MIAELAEVRVPLSELNAMKVGSMIDLGPARHVKVKINGHTALIGEPGESRGCHSLRILSRVESLIPRSHQLNEPEPEAEAPPPKAAPPEETTG